MSISIEDLHKVYRATFNARKKWRNILLALEISIATIDSIGLRWHEHSDDCFREGLTEWLRGEDRQWKDILEALSSPTVEFDDLARAIERDYKIQSTGNHRPTDGTTGREHGTDDKSRDISLTKDHPQVLEMIELRAIPVLGESFEGKLLEVFHSGNLRGAKDMLIDNQPECQSCDLRSVVDSDGKSLLHLICCSSWDDWCDIVRCLVETYNCDVSAVDKDGNTPLHEAYRCGNGSMVTYLLSCSDCTPDAINKHEYTVLRMALEKNDKVAVRELLACGRVDPRKGTSRGHTYTKLLEMSQLQPSPQEHEGSALQMVEQFAKCIEAYSHVKPPFSSFTSYCLLDILHKMINDRDHIQVKCIQEHIRANMLPLPEKASDIYVQLLEVKRSQDIHLSDSQGGHEDVKVTIVGHKGKKHPVSTEANPLSSSDKNTPPQYSPPPTHSSRDDPPSHRRRETYLASTGVKSSTKLKEQDTVSDDIDCECGSYAGIFFHVIFWSFVISAILVTISIPGSAIGSIIFAYLDNVVSGNFTVTQIEEPTVYLIGRLDLNGKNTVNLDETTDSQFIPVDFFLGACTDDLLESRTINKENEFSPLKSNRIDERYVPIESYTFIFQIEIPGELDSSNCGIILVVFDDLSEYQMFLSSGTWTMSFREFCIQNNQATIGITLSNAPYYFIGLHIASPENINGRVSYQINGSILQYTLNGTAPGCSITSAISDTCTVSLSDFGLEGASEVCILGSVSQRPDGVARSALINYTVTSSLIGLTFLYIWLPFGIFLCVCLLLAGPAALVNRIKKFG